jgi:hypothetical protein
VDGVKVHASPSNIFLGVGVILIILLCILPVWNALALMQDSVYVFWHGKTVPVSMIVVCVVVLVLYMVTITAFFSFAMPQAQTEQTMMMTANIFLTCLGLAFMLVSIPLSRQVDGTYSNLIRKCDYSPETHRLFEYSQVLRNIRLTPDCVTKYSVVECLGYEEAKPYTTFLKDMETNLKCSGFCYMSAGIPGLDPSAAATVTVAPPSKREERLAEAAVGAVTAGDQVVSRTVENATATVDSADEVAANATSDAAHATIDAAGNVLGTSLRQKRRIISSAPTALAVLSAATKSSSLSRAFGEGRADFVQGRASKKESDVRYPPTLFSFSNYQASCEGMAARHMKNFAGGVAGQTFYQGIYLVLIAVVTGFLKLFGFCVRQDPDYKPPQYVN